MSELGYEEEYGGDQERRQAPLARTDAIGNALVPFTGTSGGALQARAQAKEQARFVMAVRYPRDMFVVRERVLKECDRPAFAEIARYKRQQGWEKDEKGKFLTDEKGARVPHFIEGPSVRLIEAFLLGMRNMERSCTPIEEDDLKRIVEYTVMDIETNTSESRVLTIDKLMEKSYRKDGGEPIGVRTNSYGKPVYLYPATVDEVRQLEARQVAFARRDLGRLFIPKDMLDEAEQRCEATKARDAKDDPGALLRRTVDAFKTLGITAEQLREWAGGKPLDALSRDDLTLLRLAGVELKDGTAFWPQVLAASPYYQPEEGENPVEGAQSLKERLKKRKADVEAKAKAKQESAAGTTDPPKTDEAAKPPVEGPTQAPNKESPPGEPPKTDEPAKPQPPKANPEKTTGRRHPPASPPPDDDPENYDRS